MTIEKLADFAFGLYANARIELLSRDLQDTHYANINIILWLCWLDKHNIYLNKKALDSAIDLIGEITGEVVTLLRQARVQMKAIGHFTRVQEQLIAKHILQAEIAVEKILLERLQDLTGRLARIEGQHIEPLSLFDYLVSLEVPDAGAVGAEFLAAGRVLNRERLEG